MRCRDIKHNQLSLLRPRRTFRIPTGPENSPIPPFRGRPPTVFTFFQRFSGFVIAGALVAAAPARAQTPGTAESPTFQGHGAEMQMRDEAVEQRRRALFFDAVTLDIGPPGLPCDHLVRRRPEAVAGKGFVVILNFTRSERVHQARVWIPPGEVSSLDEARRHALHTVATKLPDQQPRIADAVEFVWCR